MHWLSGRTGIAATEYLRLSGCTRIAATEYLIRDNNVLMILCAALGIQERLLGKNTKWYKKKGGTR